MRDEPRSGAHRWGKVRAVFEAACEQPPQQRADWVRAQCGDDAELASEVLGLLACDLDGAPLEPPGHATLAREDSPEFRPLVAGRRLGAYELVREVGSGGMGTVFEARRADAQFEMRVAVKVIRGGLGEGVANEAAILPERDSDSVFAVIAEESGFLGTTGLLLLYALMIVLILSSAASIRERFSRLVVCGIGLYFAAHFFVNVGVNLGLIPMTGLTLPLFSTGGSSMFVTFLALGLALGLAAQREATLDEDAFRD